MRKLIIKGNFTKVSNSDSQFFKSLIEFLREKAPKYFKINMRTESESESESESDSDSDEFSYENKKLITELSDWRFNLKSLDKFFVIRDLRKKFEDEYIVSIFENYFYGDDEVDYDLLSDLVEELFDKYNLTDYYKLKGKKGYEIDDRYKVKDIYIELELLRNNEEIVSEIGKMLSIFCNSIGNFSITSIKDANSGEFLDMDVIFENFSFDNCFSSDDIYSFLNKQLPNDMEIEDIEISYRGW